VSNLRDDIASLSIIREGGGSLCDHNAAVMIVDRYARAIDALGGYVGNDFDRGYDAALGAVLALVDGRKNEPQPGRDCLQPGRNQKPLSEQEIAEGAVRAAGNLAEALDAIYDLVAAQKARKSR
jgi:hypothetical protein